jgi:hypothetical protein
MGEDGYEPFVEPNLLLAGRTPHVKKRLVGPLLTAAALVMPLAGAASAAVPTSRPTIKIDCRKANRHAKVWRLSKNFAADNHCDQWLRIAWHWDDEGESNVNIVNVEPGAHFNWGMPGKHLIVIATLGEPDYCAPGAASIIRKGSHGTAVAAPPCTEDQ